MNPSCFQKVQTIIKIMRVYLAKGIALVKGILIGIHFQLKGDY